MIYFLKNKSENLFENPNNIGKIKILDIRFPDFPINRYGEYFLKFTKIEELYLQSDVLNPNLLPVEIGKLVTLTKLYILNYNYQEFPEWILELKNLKYLTIRGNDIEKIPDRIDLLKNLKSLRIENCRLVNLPDSVSNLSNLKELSLSSNVNLTHLNINSLPKSLKVLNLVCSGITEESLAEIEIKFKNLKINKSMKQIS